MSYFPNEVVRLGLKQRDIMDVCGVSRQTASSWMNGLTEVPTAKLALLVELNVDVAYVVTGVRTVQSEEIAVNNRVKTGLLDSLISALQSAEEQARILKQAIKNLKKTA